MEEFYNSIIEGLQAKINCLNNEVLNINDYKKEINHLKQEKTILLNKNQELLELVNTDEIEDLRIEIGELKVDLQIMKRKLIESNNEKEKVIIDNSKMEEEIINLKQELEAVRSEKEILEELATTTEEELQSKPEEANNNSLNESEKYASNVAKFNTKMKTTKKRSK